MVVSVTAVDIWRVPELDYLRWIVESLTNPKTNL